MGNRLRRPGEPGWAELSGNLTPGSKAGSEPCRMGFKCVALGENSVYKRSRDGAGVLAWEGHRPIAWGVSCYR